VGLDMRGILDAVDKVLAGAERPVALHEPRRTGSTCGR
jgi:hypothetical protein